MSHEATNWAFQQRGLKPATKMVLLALANCHNPHHGCFPSKKRLAEDCEMSERSVSDHLKKLEDLGLIKAEECTEKRRGQFGSNRYILYLDRENCRGQEVPSAKSAVGKSEQSPSAKSAVDRRQNLPTNPVRESRKGTSKAESSGPSFDEFWKDWPTKVKRKDAEKAWKRLSPEERAEAHRCQREWYQRWRAMNPHASPIHPTSYLNGKRWEDQFSAPNGATSSPERDERLARLRRYGGQP
ncbi:helix-turn-helix domain-containing protein [Tranquillimonas rosea]|uniref:helix-turn-helix domain-containing protein n=1 Tax=Tranquillimonas rosea TaxID=641238 RepID=UPI003BA90113